MDNNNEALIFFLFVLAAVCIWLYTKLKKEQKQREGIAKDAAKNHPMILEAKALFGGELGPIELVGESD